MRSGRRVTRERGVAREVGEDGLRDFLGQLRRADLPQRGGIDQIQMPPDDFGEGVLRIFARELPEQIQIMPLIFKSISPPRPKSDRKDLRLTICDLRAAEDKGS